MVSATVNGINVGVHRIRRIPKKLGIMCKQKKKFKATTNSRHNLPVADNLLEQKFDAIAPNQVWVTDITYIPTEEGWLYLAGHKDIFIGYAMDVHMTKELVSRSLFRAVEAKQPDTGLIHHSDRGSQYCSEKTVKNWQKAIIADAERKLGRSLKEREGIHHFARQLYRIRDDP